MINTTCSRIILIDNDLHCFKSIPTHCNSLTGNVSRMWFNIHAAPTREIGQQSAPKNACCKYSGLQHRLQHSFSKCTATAASVYCPLLGMFKVTVKGCKRNTATEWTNSTTFITQNITVTKFEPLYRHRCGYNAHQNVKSHCLVVLITMSLQLL